MDTHLLRDRRAAAIVLAVLSLPVAGCQSGAEPTAISPIGSTSSLAPSSSPNATMPSAQSGWQNVGWSVLGRPIRAITVGSGPRTVLFIGGIHGDEAECAFATAQLPEAFTAAGLGELVTLTIIEDANPDGRAAGTRVNANGVDVNRNFPARNFDATNPEFGGEALSQPESRTLVETIDRTRPDLVIVGHAWRGKQFINFDGPARLVAEKFSATSGFAVEESAAFAPTPGSLGSYVGRDRGIALLTIEVLKGSDPVSVWATLKEALLQAVRG